MADPSLLCLAAAVIFAAAFVQGVTGFAHALLAIGTLSFVFGSREAVLVLSLLAPVIAVGLFVRVRRHVAWREALAIAIPHALVGTPLGIWLFGMLDEETLTRIVGVLLVVFAGWFLTPWAPRPRRLPLPVTAFAGFLAGLLSGLASTGGPPVVLYLYAREMPKDERMAVLQAVFVVGSLTKVAMLLPTGFLGAATWAHAGILVPAMLGGLYLGHALYRRLPADLIRTIALLLLVGIGVALLVS